MLISTNLLAQKWGAEAEFASRYVWQGIAYSRGPVFQPTIWVSAKGWNATFWASQRLNNEPQRGEITELTFDVGYARTLHGWTIEPGYENWMNRGRNDDSGPNTGVAEIRISHPLGSLTLFTNQMLDVQSYRGAYIGDAGLAYGKQIRVVHFDLTSSAGWASAKFNENYFGPRKAALNLFGTELSATIPMTKHTYLRPHFQWSSLLDRELRASVATADLINGGVAFGVTF